MSKYQELKIVHVLQEEDGKVYSAAINIRAKLSRIKESDQSGTVRDNQISGRCHFPVLGQTFTFLSEPYDKTISKEDGVRTISTSTVIKIEPALDNIIVFSTENSVYKLEIVDYEDLPQ
jgi:hypothetical protein